MSLLLVQRPQPTPGLIMLNARHVQQKSQSQRRQQQRVPQCNQPPNHIRRKSPAVVSTPQSVQTQPLSQAKTRNRQPKGEESTTPRKAQAQNQLAPSTPPLTPAQPAKRRSRPSPKGDLSRSLGASPFPSQVEDGGLPEWDSPPKTGSNKRSKRTSAAKDDSPSTWQQAAFVNAAPLPALDISSLVGKEGPRTAPLGGSFSTPASPVRAPTAAAQPVMTRSPTMPSFPTLDIKNRRPAAHSRTPSYPTIPMHREKDTFNMSGQLEAFLNLSLNDPSNPMFARAKPASLGSSPGIHARMAKNQKKTGPIFASASFQHAPEAMTLPKPFFRMGGASRDTSDASSDDGVIDLADERQLSEDESSDSSYTPAFLM